MQDQSLVAEKKEISFRLDLTLILVLFFRIISDYNMFIIDSVYQNTLNI